MGKIAPPSEVFAQWSPESQANYNATLEGKQSEIQTHYQNADRLNQSADQHQRNAELYQGTIDQDNGKYGSDMSKFDGTLALVYKNEAQADNDRAAAQAEIQKARQLEMEVADYEVKPAGNALASPEQLKDQYERDLRTEINAERYELAKLNQEKAEIEDKAYFNWMLDKESKQRLKEIEKQMEAIQSDLAFNQQNLDNTDPPQPPQPPTAGPIGRFFVGSGATMTCPFAMGGTSKLIVDPSRRAFVDNKQMANIMDFKPMVNVPSFGMCSAPSNPQVISATALAMGVPTPAPCVPAITAPWMTGKPDLLVEGKPALLNTDTLMCTWGGKITILPG